MEFKEALKIVTDTIKNDPELRMTYKANIAMSFKDECNRLGTKYKSKWNIHIAANKAADNFLDLLCK